MSVSTLTPPAEAHVDADPVSSFVALSRFTVSNGSEMTRKVKDAFRLHLVDTAKGFVRIDVISQISAGSSCGLITSWANQKSFEAWHRPSLQGSPPRDSERAQAHSR